MPSKSRKKIKGQARKAKAKAAATTAVNNNAQQQQRYTYYNDVTVTTQSFATTTPTCLHGECRDINCPDVVMGFLKVFYGIFFTDKALLKRVFRALDAAYSKYPEAVTNDENLDAVKKNIIQNATSSLVKDKWNPHPMTMVDTIAYAVALMVIDTYNPSSPVPAGVFDERDAKQFLVQTDIMMGCKRSLVLVKFFVNQIPCSCLDKMYSQIRSSTPKMGECAYEKCKQMKKRSGMFICTGCEREQYCSKACQVADVQDHKYVCKVWQSGRCTYDC